MNEPAVDISDFFPVKDVPSSPTGNESLPVVKWKNVSVRLFVSGTAIADIAKMVGQDVEEVKAFIHSPAGDAVVKQITEDKESVVEQIVKGAQLDNVMQLLRLRDGASSDGVKLNAVKVLQELSKDYDGGEDMSPEQAKLELERIMKGLQGS